MTKSIGSIDSETIKRMEGIYGNLRDLYKGNEGILGDGASFMELDADENMAIVTLKENGFSRMHKHEKGHGILFKKCNGLYLMMDPEGNFYIKDLNELGDNYKSFFTGNNYHGVYNRGPGDFLYFVNPVPSKKDTCSNERVQEMALSLLRI